MINEQLGIKTKHVAVNKVALWHFAFLFEAHRS